MGNLLNLQFWFNQRPDLLVPAAKNTLMGVILFLLTAAIISFILKKGKGFYAVLWKKLFNFFVANAIIGGALLFFSEELVPLLSSRFWLALWLVGAIVWIIFIILYGKTLPEQKKNFAREKELKKYIP
jgi:hypothetical protein